MTSPPSSVASSGQLAQGTIRGERGRGRRGFAGARRDAGPGDHRDLVDDDARVFNKDAVGRVGERRERLDPGPKRLEHIAVDAVLGHGAIDVDVDPAQVRQHAVGQPGTDLAHERDDRSRRRHDHRALLLQREA